MRIILADDSLLVREGLTRLLEHLGHEVVAQADSAEALLDEVTRHHPEIVLIDIKMPPSYTDEGLRAAATIRRKFEQTGVLVLSQYMVASYATSLLDQAPTHTGYLLKDRILNSAVIVDAMKRVAAGDTVIDPELVRILLRPDRATSPLVVLSTREREILAHLAEGLSDRGIASKLFISTNTVGTHIQRIFAKLGLPDSSNENRRVHAVLKWLQNQG
jgi:DNA-binding NarL/FixJ family response regulator